MTTGVVDPTGPALPKIRVKAAKYSNRIDRIQLSSARMGRLTSLNTEHRRVAGSSGRREVALCRAASSASRE